MKDLLPWQKNLLTALYSAGTSKFVISTPRGHGKSFYNQYITDAFMVNDLIPFKKLTEATVDGVPWYTIKCNDSVSRWIRSIPNDKADRWYEHVDTNWYVHKNIFDVCEQVYIEVGLKWS